MATEHAKPSLDAVCSVYDDYTMKQNHFKLKCTCKKLSKTQLLFFSGCCNLINEGFTSFSLFHIPSSFILQSSLRWPISSRDPHVSASQALGLQAHATIPGFLLLLEGVLEIRPPAPMPAWPTPWLTKPSLQPELCFLRQRCWSSFPASFSEAEGLVTASMGCEKDSWALLARATFGVKFLWVTQNSYHLDVLFSILYYSKQAGTDFSRL